MARVDVIMPQMGESIAEGTLSKWVKQVGDAVKRDETIFEISTDKVDAEIPAPSAGVLAEILVQPGQTVPVGTVVARLETDVAAFAATVEVNLLAPFRLLRAFLPAWRARGTGHVVTIGSVADRHPFPDNGAYAASKYGARALHEVVRAETQGTGVRCALVSPGPVDTPLWDPVQPETREGFPSRAAMLRAADVADAVVWVATRPAHVNIDELRLGRT